jgi:hypothetical protein
VTNRLCLHPAPLQHHSAGDTLPPLAASPDQALLPHSLPPGLGAAVPGVRRQEKIGVESVYHVQAVSIVEEAIIRWVGGTSF